MKLLRIGYIVKNSIFNTFMTYFFINWLFYRYAPSVEFTAERRKPAVSRMKQIINNNSDHYNGPLTVVMTQGNKVRSSLQRHEKQQEELFEL